MGEYYLESLLPLALSMGMTATEFWEEDPALLWSYYLAHKRKLEMDAGQMDLQAWLHGSYVYEGVASVISNALSGKSRGQKLQYPVRPRAVKRVLEERLTEEEQLHQQQQEMAARIRMMHSSLGNVPKLANEQNDRMETARR